MSGYEKVANFMSNYDSMAVFKRFNFLNNLNALYLQAELESLEQDIKGYMKAGFPPGTSDLDDESIVGLGESEDEEATDGDVSQPTVSNTSSTTSVPTDAQATTSQITTPINQPPDSIELQNASTSSHPLPPSSPPYTPAAAVNWWKLANQEENQKAWSTMLNARQRLKEYNKTLLIQKHLYAAPSPHKHDLKTLRQWLQHEHGGNRPIWSIDGNIWNDSPPTDLIALSPWRGEDPLGNFVMEFIPPLWHNCIGRRLKKPIDEEMQLLAYKNTHILRVVDGFSTIISSLLLVASIVVLHFITNTLARLTVIAVFTTVFSFALTLMTNARMVEVFAGTTGFAAVQVVFVGSTSAMPAP